MSRKPTRKEDDFPELDLPGEEAQEKSDSAQLSETWRRDQKVTLHEASPARIKSPAAIEESFRAYDVDFESTRPHRKRRLWKWSLVLALAASASLGAFLAFQTGLMLQSGGTLRISPDGPARVKIDGKSVANADLSDLSIPADRAVEVSVEKTGYLPFKKYVFARGAEKLAEVELIPLNAGSLTVTSTPNADVRISRGEDVWTRRTPVEQLQVPPGEYVIRFEDPKTEMTTTQNVAVRAGGHVLVSESLSNSPASRR